MTTRVLILAQDFLPHTGGISRYVNMLGQALPNQVTIIAPAGPNVADMDASLRYGIHRYRPWPRLGALKLGITTLWLSLRARPAMCLISGFGSCHAGLGFWLARLLIGTHYGLITYGTDMSVRERGLMERAKQALLSHADVIITISEESKRRVIELGAPERKVRLLPPCLDLSSIGPVDSSELRSMLDLDAKRVVLTVGRLVPRKGHRRVLQALSLLCRDRPDLAYVIVGKGPLEAELRTTVDELHLGENVIFAGFVPDSLLAQYYSLCDVFCMTSHESEPGDYEGFGIVYLEANACGKPVVAGHGGGAADAVLDGETGLLVEPDDIAGIAAAIRRLLDDPELARRLGENGRQRVQRELSWTGVGGRLKQCLQVVSC